MRLPQSASDATAKTTVRRIAGWVVVVGVGVAVGYRAGGSTGVRVVALIVEAVVLASIRASMPRRPAVRPMTTIRDANAGFARYRHFIALLRPATASAADFDRSVRPALLRLYGQTLATRHGVSMSSDRERARELMGDAGWLLDGPDGRAAARVGSRELESLVSKLEELSS